MSSLEDRVVVITGASSGIGAALAKIVGEGGGKPVLLARREGLLAEAAKLAGPHALPLTVDVTSRTQVETAVQRALERFGHVDVWVNNAGRGITRMVSELT